MALRQGPGGGEFLAGNQASGEDGVAQAAIDLAFEVAGFVVYGQQPVQHVHGASKVVW